MVGRLSGNASCQVGIRKYTILRAASRQGLTHPEITPFDIVHPATPKPVIKLLQIRSIRI
jgi:hypothetical protein